MKIYSIAEEIHNTKRHIYCMYERRCSAKSVQGLKLVFSLLIMKLINQTAPGTT